MEPNVTLTNDFLESDRDSERVAVTASTGGLVVTRHYAASNRSVRNTPDDEC